MKIKFFSAHGFEQKVFENLNQTYEFEISYIDTKLNSSTAVLAQGADAVCCFVNDTLDRECIQELAKQGVKHIALRSAGFNHVDLKAADEFGLVVSRVPAYSPHAIAEYAVGMLLTLNRKIHRAHYRVRELDFSLEGLVGFDLSGKTVGIVGAGKIGKIFAEIMVAFGCEVLVVDPKKDSSLEGKVTYTDLEDLLRRSDVVSLHLPLSPKTFHLIDAEKISLMKDGVFILNTGRGALIDTQALIKGLKYEKIGAAALDVYEEEEHIFFQDLSDQVIKDDVFARLLTFPNVLVTSHQAFLTKEALTGIGSTVLENIESFNKKGLVPDGNLLDISFLS